MTGVRVLVIVVELEVGVEMPTLVYDHSAQCSTKLWVKYRMAMHCWVSNSPQGHWTG